MTVFTFVSETKALRRFSHLMTVIMADPVGVVVFLRDSPTEVIIIHIAVHPDYALHGRRAKFGVGMALVDKVKEIASRIVGVQQIVFFYRPDVVIRV